MNKVTSECRRMRIKKQKVGQGRRWKVWLVGENGCVPAVVLLQHGAEEGGQSLTGSLHPATVLLWGVVSWLLAKGY